MSKKRKIAIYLRLSLEDGEGEESNSISSQRKLLLEYINRSKEWQGVEVAQFQDDGFSGTNMDRPGVQELLKQVKQGMIQCVLVKDMSRFSRDYLELGDYLNQIFPFLRVRFIALNDHYDSKNHEGNTIGMDTAFQTLLYDLYSKDVSVKVKSAVKNKCERGEYVFGQVPLGYAKSRTEKNTVVVEETEAKIVRYIFSLAIEGFSSGQIAKKLFEEKIPTATQMRYPHRKLQKEHHTWSSTVVRTILNNRFYLGEMAYGKSIRKEVGSKEGIRLPKEEWKVIFDHHEPLVTPEQFAFVSSFGSEWSTKRKREKHPLTGKLYCGGCGYSMNYKPRGRGKMPNHFWCRKHALLQIKDCCTYFRASHLEEIILLELYREIMYRGELVKQREALELVQKEMLERLKKEKVDVTRLYQSCLQEKSSLYERYATGQLNVKEYRCKTAELTLQLEDLSTKAEKIDSEYDRVEEEYRSPKQDMKEIIRFSGLKELTQEAVDVFIKRITVYRDKRVEIEWNYREGEA